jgi:hypothetical protein
VKKSQTQPLGCYVMLLASLQLPVVTVAFAVLTTLSFHHPPMLLHLKAAQKYLHPTCACPIMLRTVNNVNSRPWFVTVVGQCTTWILSHSVNDVALQAHTCLLQHQLAFAPFALSDRSLPAVFAVRQPNAFFFISRVTKFTARKQKQDSQKVAR